MKHLSIIILSFFLSLPLLAQNINVADFYLDENDLTANQQGTMVMDQNGEKCALIRVQTTQMGFNFEVGSLGVTDTKQKTGEIWVYLPHGAKKITIRHQQLGTCDYTFPVNIEKAKTYMMTLTTGTVTTVVTEAKVKTGWILLDSNPQGAAVYINDEYAGDTPLSNCKKAYGSYTYRLEKDKYHNATGNIELNSGRYEETVELKPAFGDISISSNPSGANVNLDGNSTGKKTPCTLSEIASGDHKISFQLEKYAPKQLNVTVEDGQTAKANAELSARFAKVTVNSLDGAKILVDGTEAATGKYSDDLMEGYHDFEAQKAHHRSASKQVEVIAGQPQEINLNPTPIYGSLDITSDPPKANITIDGKSYGTTPTTIDEILEGEHNIQFSLQGYASTSQTFTIKDGESSSVTAKLENGRPVTITTDKVGSEIYIDGQKVGNSPYNGILTFGIHNLYAVADGIKTRNDVINISADSTDNIPIKLVSGNIKIYSTEKDVTLYIDGMYIGKCPFTGYLKPGKHSTYGMSNTRKSQESKFEIKENEELVVILNF